MCGSEDLQQKTMSLVQKTHRKKGFFPAPEWTDTSSLGVKTSKFMFVRDKPLFSCNFKRSKVRTSQKESRCKNHHTNKKAICYSSGKSVIRLLPYGTLRLLSGRGTGPINHANKHQSPSSLLGCVTKSRSARS